MNSIINKTTLSPPPFCEKEILRYAGCRQSNDEITSLIKSAISKARQLLEYKVCYKELPVTVTGDICDFSEFQVKSEKLAANLRECETVILLAATVGIKIDRLIARYSVTSPALAHILDALGTERIEALCDAFCSRQEIERGCGLKPRFSPGYGDLSLQTQKAIFKSLVDKFGCDPAAMKQAGIAYATDQIIDLYANGITNVHVYSMNKPDVAEKIQSNLSDILGK